MNAYYEVLNILKTSLDNNIDVNTVTQGDDPLDLSKKNIFPLVHISLDTGTFREGITVFDIQLQALDQVRDSKELVTDKFNGNNNAIDVDNNMVAVLRRTFDELIKDKYTKDIVIVGDGDIQKVKGEANNLNGWEVSFQIEVPNNVISIC